MTLVIACGSQYLGAHGWVGSPVNALQFETEADARLWPSQAMMRGRDWRVTRLDPGLVEPVMSGDALRHDWDPFGGAKLANST